ncbi:hypothetical protein DEU56DRAFT_807644 [Suillus clintonianus]|uniref:uncharacterized protein n=1 Tax=Suillus clintonianus TaxID=1904413 RepID=UPI001B8761C4|nr:uncharacterized protein DEU56DRAFT_807644 [Suillus clintonianus]KAG2135330.1 hypothetical protein DEU56DRAFT_807644 [Suillus clintonianus]
MLRWQSLALQVTLAACVLASADPSLESKEPSDALPQCQARAWVRAPDMGPGDIIAGDVRIRLSGPCADVESYALGLRYKENIFWKLRSIGFTHIIRDTCSLNLSRRRQDAPIPKQPEFKYNHTDSNYDLFQVRMPFYMTADYNETEWATYQNSVQNKELWSLYEEERIAFEIKTPLVGEKGTDPLLKIFASRFGILVPNTNYPPGLDYRSNAWSIPSAGATDTVSTESIYEYFVEIRFGNGTISEIPAGITSFTPLYLSTKDDTLRRNISLVPQSPGRNSEPVVDVLRSNYTIELSFPGRVYQNSSVNITATVHRMGYTNRTDAPMQLCASLNGPDVIEWHHQELKNRSRLFGRMINALVPFVEPSRSPPFFPHPCREISFEAAPIDLTCEGRISSSFSKPFSLSVHISHNSAPDFLAYYCQKLGYNLDLSLQVKPDTSEPWEQKSEKAQWEKQAAAMDESDFDWVPWLPAIQTRRRFLTGSIGLSVISMQKRCPVRSTPVHYLSDEARQPAFVDVSDIVDLRSMSLEERDLLAPFAQPSIKVFAKGEELNGRYFSAFGMEERIYVGETWANKVLPLTAEGPRKEGTVDHSVFVHC